LTSNTRNDAPTASIRKIKTINPATEQVLKEYEIIDEEQVNESVRRARNAFAEWKKDIDKRADHLYSFANELRKNKENLARTATQEMGNQYKNPELKSINVHGQLNTLRIMQNSSQQAKSLTPMQEKAW
jgi:acyl-CoA reductase-like NAD-dependent aldehyde dehydrogenase